MEASAAAIAEAEATEEAWEAAVAGVATKEVVEVKIHGTKEAAEVKVASAAILAGATTIPVVVPAAGATTAKEAAMALATKEVAATEAVVNKVATEAATKADMEEDAAVDKETPGVVAAVQCEATQDLATVPRHIRMEK